MNKIGNISGKNILFLQGPMGDFFKQLDSLFQKRGAKTYKIGFNAGDWYFSNKDNYIPFREKKEAWKAYIEKFLKRNKIDMIYLFGDCRYYQNQAITASLILDIDIFVFEEGYVRPHYITMEKFGVNDFSRIIRDPNFYLQQSNDETIATPLHAKQSKFKMVYSATLYYLLSNIFTMKYPHYKHHRDFSARKEALFGIRGLLRKALYTITEKKYLMQIEGELSKRYFFVPLQTYNDFQILQHSQYGSIEKFIIEVLKSFAKHANKEDFLVFKHHPVDRGRRNHVLFIEEYAKKLHIANRILVFHDVHLPSCLKNAKGTVTINSTVGLSSLGHGIPTITLGNAIYDIEGLTCKDMNLKDFWKEPCPPNDTLYQKFTHYLIDTTQLNGSYYGIFPVEFEKDAMYTIF